MLLRNADQQFICKNVFIKNTSDDSVLKIPVAHGEGRYFAPENVLEKLQQNDQVIYRYCDEDGNVSEEANANGSMHNIAGICNEDANVFGMMPHPERACSALLGNEDGIKVFDHILGLSHKGLTLV